ncbi:MAG: tetratricopeptide repeat protein [Candidatus Brocadiia bacterium]
MSNYKTKIGPFGIKMSVLFVAVLFCFSRAGVLGAESADRMFERGERLARNKEYSAAIQAMLDFQTKHPDDKRVPQAQFLVGRYQQQRNYLNTAVKEYEMLFEDFPETKYAGRAHWHMADIYVHKEQFEKAAEVLEELAEDFKGSYEAFHGLRKLGEVCLKMKNKEKAEEAFKRMIGYNAVEMMENNSKTIANQIDQDIHRGVLFVAERAIKEKNYETARYAYSRLADKWEKVRLLIDLLYRQDKLGEIHDLIREMEDKDYWKAQNILFEFYVRRESMRGLRNLIRVLTNKYEKNENLTELFKQVPKSIRKFSEEDKRTVYDLIATRYRPLRRMFEFEVCKLESVRRQEPGTLKRFILTYNKGKDVEQCKRWRAIYLELHKKRKEAIEQYWDMENKEEAHFYVAESYHGEFARRANNVDRAAAIVEYMKIRKHFYSTEATCRAYWQIGQLYADGGNKKKAVETLEELEKRFVGQPNWQVRARFQIAEWYRHWKKYEDAIQNYRRVAKQYPNTHQQRRAIYNIGLCWEQLGEKEMAVRSFLECIRRFEKTRVQSEAHSRLEVKYKVPDLQIRDMAKDKD